MAAQIIPTTLPSGHPAWTRAATIGDCDGALDKADSATEGTTPYAWTWYSEIGGMLGSWATSARGTLVHAVRLALARNEAARTRAAEKLPANAVPGTADEALAQWVDILHVRQLPTDSRGDIRARAAARFKAAVGPTFANEDEAISDLLGPAFVRCWRQTGADLATPPTLTYWPTANPGPASHDLGGGAWLSERCHLVVETRRPPGMSDDDYLHLLNVELFEMLDEMLPMWATANWAEGVTAGFLLDISQLDYTGM